MEQTTQKSFLVKYTLDKKLSWEMNHALKLMLPMRIISIFLGVHFLAFLYVLFLDLSGAAVSMVDLRLLFMAYPVFFLLVSLFMLFYQNKRLTSYISLFGTEHEITSEGGSLIVRYLSKGTELVLPLSYVSTIKLYRGSLYLMDSRGVMLAFRSEDFKSGTLGDFVSYLKAWAPAMSAKKLETKRLKK